MEVDEIYMENLDEFINEENRVVTYKWLSRTLSVHVNQAKQMLYWFVECQRNKQDNDHLNVTYLVAGTVISGNGSMNIRVVIVPEEQLDVTKSKFHSLTSVHVYSVQKAKVKDPNPLYLVDFETLKENVIDCNKFSAVLCKNAQARSGAELDQLRTAAQPTSAAPNFAKTKQNGTALKTQGKKSSDITGMFANAATSKKNNKTPPQEDVKQCSSDQKKSTDKPAAKPTQGSNKPKPGVKAFFGKQSDKPKELDEKQNQTEQTKQDSAKDDEVPMEVEAPEIVETKTTKKTDDVKREPKKEQKLK